MKSKKINNKISKLIFGCLLFLSAFITVSMAEAVRMCDKFYVGIFGGGGRINNIDFSQYGTVFIPEAGGGPLAVNAFGNSSSDSTVVMGAHIGFVLSNNWNMFFRITPAIEFETYCMRSTELSGHAINNTLRLVEQDFFVTYPLKTRAFLINAVLNPNSSVFKKFMPYLGIGIGSSRVSISDATSTQLNPAETGINHYNANPNDRSVTFASQIKAGLRFNLHPRVKIFAEYRFLYLAETDYIFGSTVNPTHVETSPWLVKIHPQHYNIGTVGLSFYL